MLTMIEGDCPHCDAINSVRPEQGRVRRWICAVFFRMPLKCKKCGVRFSVHRTPAIIARLIDFLMP